MFAIKAPVVSVVASAQTQKCEKKATWVFARSSSSLDFELYFFFFSDFGGSRWEMMEFRSFPAQKSASSLREKREKEWELSQNEREQQAGKDIYIYIHRTYLFKVALPFASSANAREFETSERMNLFFFISKSLFASKCTFLGQKIRKNEGRFYSLSETKGKGTALCVRFNASEKTVRFFSLFKSR